MSITQQALADELQAVIDHRLNDDTNGVNRKWVKILHRVLTEGTVVSKDDERTGTGCVSLFGGITEVFDTENFPLIGYKHVSAKQSFGEILAMMNGATNTEIFKTWGAGSIWDDWATESGDLGPIYGKQWRGWATPNCDLIDQLKAVIYQLRHHPYSRRHVVTAWNPADLPLPEKSAQENVKAGRMALPPCHYAFQFGVTHIGADNGFLYQERMFSQYKRAQLTNQNDPEVNALIAKKIHQLDAPSPTMRLDMTLEIRSNDLFLGAPYNIAGYALMLKLFAQYLDMMPGKLFYRIGNAHVYLNHFDAIADVVRNYHTKVKSHKHQLGQGDGYVGADLCYPLVLTPIMQGNPWEINPKDILVLNYEHLGVVKAPIAI
jgi:thymidylate synthase